MEPAGGEVADSDPAGGGEVVEPGVGAANRLGTVKYLIGLHDIVIHVYNIAVYVPNPNAAPLSLNPSEQMVNLQFQVGEPVFRHSALSEMITIMGDVMKQQRIHTKVAVVTLNLLPLELVKVVMKAGVYNDEIEGISQWLLLVESSVIKPKSNIYILDQSIIIGALNKIGNLYIMYTETSI